MRRNELQHPGSNRKPTLVSGLRVGFSLIEVVLAVGVISFALVGIIGLFPVAMQSALDSQRETQVAFIARSLFSELQRVDGDQAFISVTGPNADGTRPPLTTATSTPVSLTGDSEKFYFDVDGGMLAADTNAVYEAEVVTTTADQPPGLARVDINISVPAGAPTANRTTYNFVTLINYTPPPPAPVAP